jgi:hypothetical protein
MRTTLLVASLVLATLGEKDLNAGLATFGICLFVSVVSLWKEIGYIKTDGEALY